jgi:hypothetical protein|tara:strand:- start:1789 stop:2028 length:240 start_codon:yes stop_codon:yes gene_type:complete
MAIAREEFQALAERMANERDRLAAYDALAEQVLDVKRRYVPMEKWATTFDPYMRALAKLAPSYKPTTPGKEPKTRRETQ